MATQSGGKSLTLGKQVQVTYEEYQFNAQLSAAEMAQDPFDYFTNLLKQEGQTVNGLVIGWKIKPGDMSACLKGGKPIVRHETAPDKSTWHVQ